MPKITIINPVGIAAQNNAATYFRIPSLYFKGTPNVLKIDINPCFKCVDINNIEAEFDSLMNAARNLGV